MPLPAALLARLAKRGIVEQQATAPTDTKKPGEEVEEVFAEDYDDPSKPEPEVTGPSEPYVQPVPGMAPPPLQQAQVVHQGIENETLFFETTACPIRSNPYHECLAYCRRRYGLKQWNPQPDMIRKRNRMLGKYPLPAGWVEVGDFDTNRYYYWNINTDEVSWLSPTHPKAQISSSAESLGIVGKIGNLDSDGEEPMETRDDEEEDDDVNSESGSGTSLSDEEEDYEERQPRGRSGGKRGEPRKGRVKDDLDPMDPAAYSDIPRGGWNEGLDTRGKAKTGVDVTATGPLFQQRPYPSPGDILRANQSMKKKK